MNVAVAGSHNTIVNEIRAMNWPVLSTDEMVDLAWAYYFFSVQFRESLEIALELLPNDANLQQLAREECGTSNLSPWPGVAAPEEKMNHDEFMRRVLSTSPIGDERRTTLERLGASYLQTTRATSRMAQAMSIASYEAGGLETVFRAFLTARHWDGPLLEGFKHFLIEHIRFDSDPEQGHGALSRHLAPDDRIVPLWAAFRDLLVSAVPALARQSA